MSTYQRYQQARDAAWETLIACGVSSLPVNAKEIAEKLGVQILPWPERKDSLFSLLEKAGGGICRSLRIRGKWHIFLQSGQMDDQHVHFAIAHELGHVMLQHDLLPLSPGIRAFRSRENEGDVMDDPLDLSDYAADIFAIRLLAPACVLHGLNIRKREYLIRITGLPPKAAALRAERMGLLRERNAFLSHPLERKVHDQFLPFIRKQNTPILPRLEINVTYPPLPRFRESMGYDAPAERKAPPTQGEKNAITPTPPPEIKKRPGRWLLPAAAMGALIAAILLLFIFR